MDGPLELPGEANPLSEEILIQVLTGAASSNQRQIQESTKQLQVWETREHYYAYLQSAFVDHRLPLEVRWIAITQLKNGIDKYWRKTALNAVSKEDKEVIRSRLLESGLNEGDSRLATANALVIAKIVRYEYPNTWPNVIPQLVQLLRTGASSEANPQHLSNALNMTLRVVKELSTGRLRSTKASLQAAAPELLRTVGQIYTEKIQQTLSGMNTNDLEEWYITKNLTESLLAVKVARRLLIAGYEDPHKDSDVRQLIDIIDQHFNTFLTVIYQASPGLTEATKNLLEKHLVQFGKFYVDFAQTHALPFVLVNGKERLSQLWQLIVRYGQAFGSKPADFSRIGTDGDAEETEKPAIEKVTLKCLLVMRACLKLLYQPTAVLKFKKEERKQQEEEGAQCKHILRDEVFTDGFVVQMMDVIVRQYFIFRASDLREWEEEPDDWEKREEAEGEDFETSIRSCSEKLFLDLAIHREAIVIPPLMEVFHSVATTQNEDVLLKDSVYTAIGIAAATAKNRVDFDAFLTSTLVPEVQKQLPGYKVLRRRIAILIGQWISVKVGETARSLVYEIFRFLLDNSQPMNDQVVRVTAGRQLRNVVDDWGFQAEPFRPFVSDILSRLMALIGEVELPETKLALLNTISVIVERLERDITPYADRIVSLLPPLWDQSGNEHLMKQAILTLLARLFTSMGSKGSQYHHLALPIIAGAVEPGSETQVYLLDDALDLWHTIVMQTPTPSSPDELNQDLLSMIKYLIPVLELLSDAFRVALAITESYIILSPTTALQPPFLNTMLTSLASMLGTLKPEASGHVTNVIEALLRAAEMLGGADAVRTLASEMVASGFFGALVEGLRGSWSAHQTTGPKASVNRIEGLVETDYFALLARIAYATPQTLLEALAAVPEAAAPPAEMQNKLNLQGVEASLAWLLEEWFSHTEDVSDPSRRKLMALALTRVLGLHQPFILNRLQSLMSMWTDVITELTDGREDRSVDSLVYDPAETWGPVSSEAPSGSPEEERRKRIAANDPVHAVNLVEVVREGVVGAVQRSGGEERFREEWLVNVDGDVVAAFGGLGLL